MKNLLCCVAVASCASVPEVKPIINYCNIEGVFNQATQSRIGEAWVTNYHVISQCPEKVIAYDSIRDLALIQKGPPPNLCQNAKSGDTSVVYGIDYTDIEVWSKNKVEGKVVRVRKATLVDRNTQKELGEITEIVVTQENWVVRPGYSGGLIYDLKTNRPIGILNASNETRVHGIPIETVCRFIDLANEKEGELSNEAY